MPPLTRWCIKSALVYLVVSLLIGVALAAQGAIALPAAVGVLMPVYSTSSWSAARAGRW